VDFELNEDQQMLKDSVDRLTADLYEFERRKHFRQEPKGYSEEMWGRFAEQGLLMLPFAEEDGGLGLGGVETMIVMEALGRSLVVEPYFATVVLSGGLIRHAGSAEQKAELVAAIGGGELTVAFAHAERGARHELAHVETKAVAKGSGYALTGEKSLVLFGDSADKLIVSARLSGKTRDRGGIALFLVDGNAPGVSRRGYETQDGLRAAEISLEGVEAELMGPAGAALPLIERAVGEAIAALCAEAVGIMADAHKSTVDYLKVRTQFGQPIGNFQALQHRAAEMYVALEQARSMALYVTALATSDDEAERSAAVHAAKVQIGRSSRFIGQQAIQLHGGVGVTDEYKVAHSFKRLTMIEMLFGDADHHLAKLAAGDGLLVA
jgi:pimeloyl-CoA dehydrogenase small subunit